ncbi:MAG: hypothetical protein JNM89_05350 [Hyphomicrobiaceae bacterium]|nr:hypothetical protein [Hyphomicrobiaceae bacterium]
MATPGIDERSYDSDSSTVLVASHTTQTANPVVYPEVVFETPAAITLDRDLTLDDKLRALANWDRSVRRKLMATSRDADVGARQRAVQLLDGIETARATLQRVHGRVSADVPHQSQPATSSESELLTPTEARQGSTSSMNARILEHSLLLATLAAAVLYVFINVSGS